MPSHIAREDPRHQMYSLRSLIRRCTRLYRAARSTHATALTYARDSIAASGALVRPHVTRLNRSIAEALGPAIVLEAPIHEGALFGAALLMTTCSVGVASFQAPVVNALNTPGAKHFANVYATTAGGIATMAVHFVGKHIIESRLRREVPLDHLYTLPALGSACIGTFIATTVQQKSGWPAAVCALSSVIPIERGFHSLRKLAR